MEMLSGEKKGGKINPPRVLAYGFASLIILGTLLLNLPIASKTGESVGLIDAFFTASSAVCVTGLVVVNTQEFWSTFGHVVIIALIQMGGLGFMTITTVGALILGKKLTFKDRLIIKEQLNQDTMTGLVKLTKYVLFATLAIESIGAIFLSTRFIPEYGLVKGIWFSVFHSISAFCNAGFDIIGDGIIEYAGDTVIVLTISSLIILGGLGFSVYIDIERKRSFKRLQLHSKLAITITIFLLLVGTVLFFIIEDSNPDTIKNMTGKDKLLASFFQSVITRTAGFSSVDLSKIYDTTAFVMIILMFIGGSPGSTGGGIKTTTFGVLMLTTLSVIRGERDVVAFKKRVNTDIIFRALAIVMVSMGLIMMVSFVLTLTEEFGFLDILFETTSAFATVGVTRGITSNLSVIGKIIISLTMYAGRVGPLTMAFAFASKAKNQSYRYSEANVLVG